MCKKLMAMALCLCMLFGMLPANAVQEIGDFQPPLVQSAPAADTLSTGETLQSGSCGDSVTWTLDDQGKLTISGSGPMADYEEKKAPWYSARKQVTSVYVDFGVTRVGNGAFTNFVNLTSVSLVSGLTSIGQYAFRGCTALKEVSIPDTVTAIEQGAFYECKKLESVSLPEGLKSIGYIAFGQCTSLPGITLPESLINDGGRSFGDSFPCTVYENGRYLGSSTNPYMLLIGTVEDCTSFTAHPDTKVIGGYAFEDANNLTDVSLPEGLIAISDMAFNGCDEIVTIDLPNSLQHIGASAFYCCYALSEIHIPAEVRSIGDGAFAYCRMLSGIWVSPANFYFSNDDQGVLYDHSKRVLYAARISGSYVIPRGVEIIAPKAFQGLGITAIEIPDTVTEIGSAAFFECAKLTEVILPDSVTTIGANAFYKCTKLGSMTLPDSVTYIGNGVFSSSAVSKIYFEGDVPTFHPNAFAYITATAYYPMGNETWTEEVRQSYGGTITWEEYEVQIPVIDSGTCGDNLFWEYLEDGTLVISGTGEMWNYKELERAPWMSYQHQILKLVIEDGVTSVGNYAFDACQSLKEVIIGKDVTSLGSYAFWRCLFMKVTILGNVTSASAAFSSCDVEEVTFGEGVTTICDGMFTGCRSLTKVTIPEGVTSIGKDAFTRCTALKSIQLPQSLESIGTDAFSSCSALVSIEIPDLVTSIGDRVFRGCTALSYVVIPAGLTTIGYEPFENCSNLWHVLYQGTKEQRDASALAELLTDLVWHYEYDDTVIEDTVKKLCSLCIANCTHAYEGTVIAPTCTVGGYTLQTCSLCNHSYTTDPTEPTGHSGEWILENEPNCYSSGWEYRTCDVCGEYERKETPSSGHDYGEWTVQTEPSCLPGREYRVCQICGSYDYREVPGTGHSFVFEMTVEPTCTAQGFDRYICQLCYGTYEDNFTDPIDHSYENLACIHCGEPEPVYEIDSGSCGTGVYWKLDNYGLLTIYGSGAIKDFTSTPTWIFAGTERVVTVVIEEGITGIGAGAFRYCEYMTSISIPETVTYIGEYAFSACKSLWRIQLPESIESIGPDAFSWCEALRSIEIPSRVTQIADSTFYGCIYLKQIRLPEGLTRIGEYAFTDCVSLQGIVMPDTVTELGYGAFLNCASLKELVLSDGLTALGMNAFNDCVSLEYVELPQGLTLLNGAFSGCSSLKRIELPAGVTDIGYRCFYKCTALEEVVILGNVTEIGEYAFYYCSSLKSIVLPDTVTIIDDYAFQYCSSLTTINIPDSVTEIRSYAFANTKLTHLVLGNSVQWIYGRAFEKCSYLAWIYVPKSLEEVGNAAFISCPKLWHVLYQGTEDDWRSLVFNGIGSNTNNHYLLNADRHYQSIGTEICDMVHYSNCTDPGWLGFVCEECQLCIAEVLELPARGHSWIAATCTEPEYCGRCGEVEDPTMLPHSYVDGVCTACGYVYPASQGLLMYEVLDEQGNVIAYEVGGRGECPDAEIFIPYEHNGLPVVRICANAFASDLMITSVVIPDSVTEIGQMAFFWCENLRSAILPAYITRLEMELFYYCTSLEHVVIPEGVVEIETYAFTYCTSLKHIKLPDSLQVIESGAFMNSGLESIVIPDGMTALSYQTFQSCNNLKYVDLGCLTDLGNSSFYYCYALETIVFPEGITFISNAFGYCDRLQYLEIPDSVTELSYYAFEYCYGLEVVILPTGIQRIGNAFTGCDALCHVFYKGTEEQWEQVIDHDSYWLHQGSFHCNYTGEEIHHDDGWLCLLCHPTGGHSYGDWENQNYDDCHIALCSCGARIREAHAFDQGVAIRLPTIYDLGLMEYTCTVCGYVRQEDIPRLIPTDRLENEDEDVLLEVHPSGGAIIDSNAVLTVDPVEGDDLGQIQELAGANIQQVVGEDAQLISAFDISLMLYGVQVQPGGVVAVTLPALPEGTFYESLMVVYVDDNGSLIPCETTVNADGTITFITDHFSCYAVVITPMDVLRGDVDGDGDVDSDDAIYLLYYTFQQDAYPINQSGDMDGDGDVDSDDAIYLLYYTFQPNDYPLH